MFNVLQTSQTNEFVPLVIGECGTEIVATFKTEADANAYASALQEEFQRNCRIVVRAATPDEWVSSTPYMTWPGQPSDAEVEAFFS